MTSTRRSPVFTYLPLMVHGNLTSSCPHCNAQQCGKRDALWFQSSRWTHVADVLVQGIDRTVDASVAEHKTLVQGNANRNLHNSGSTSDYERQERKRQQKGIIINLRNSHTHGILHTSQLWDVSANKQSLFKQEALPLVDTRSSTCQFFAGTSS